MGLPDFRSAGFELHFAVSGTAAPGGNPAWPVVSEAGLSFQHHKSIVTMLFLAAGLLRDSRLFWNPAAARRLVPQKKKRIIRVLSFLLF